MFLNIQLVKGRPVVPPLEIKTFHCLRPMQAARTLEIRIIQFMNFPSRYNIGKNTKNVIILTKKNNMKNQYL